MKLSLQVLTPGKMKGKAISITLSQFLIGRDPQCHLRPASPIVSNRHCALLVRGSKVYVRDFNSTNGTFVNERPVTNQVQLHDQDLLRIGPVAFSVHMEPAAKGTPLPARGRRPTETADDAAAALLLSLQEEGSGDELEPEDVPAGSTLMDIIPSVDPSATEAGAKGSKKTPGKSALGDTSTAANDILKKYVRRPRT